MPLPTLITSLVERISGSPTRAPYEHKVRTLGELYILSADDVYSDIKKINEASREVVNYEKEHSPTRRSRMVWKDEMNNHTISLP